MTYTSANPFPPDSPQAKLADKNWRWRNSWWIFAPIIGCGFFGFIGFLVAAIRTGKRHYWVSTAAYAFVGALALILFGIAGEEGTRKYDILTGIALVPFLGALFGPIIHAAIKNRDYLTTIAHKGQWYLQPQAPVAPEATPTSFMDVSNSDYFAPGQPARPSTPDYQQTPPPTPQPATYPAGPQSPSAATRWHSSPSAAGQVDINSAAQPELAAALGIDNALAAQVILARATHGRFDNLDDLANRAKLQPHQLIRFRNKVTFGGPSSGLQHPPTGPTGRILDF